MSIPRAVVSRRARLRTRDSATAVARQRLDSRNFARLHSPPMTPTPRVLSDQEFAALNTDEKYNYLYAMIQFLLGSRGKVAAESAATVHAVPPAEHHSAPDRANPELPACWST